MSSGSDRLRSEFDEHLRQELADAAAPGGAGALMWDGQTILVAHGVSSALTRVPVNGQTLFRVGSISKPVLATAVLRLVDEGRLALDDQVQRCIPGFQLHDQSAAARVTVRDLLTHRGGWLGDFIEDAGSNNDALARHVQHMASLPQVVAPGTSFSYSNAGYAVLGHVLERVTSSAFEEALTRLVLGPCGIQARFSAAETITSWFAVGHNDEGSVLDRWELPRCSRPSGGLVATPAELLRFADLFIDSSEASLSAQSRELMATPETDAVGTEELGDEYGLGWFLRVVDGTTILSHGGDVLGQHALLVIVPAAGFALALAVNSPAGERTTGRIAAWALRDLVGLDPRPRLRRGEVPAAVRQGLLGSYESSLHRVDVSSDVAGALRLTLEPKSIPGLPPLGRVHSSRIEVFPDDTVRLTDPPLSGTRVRVVRDAAGKVAFLRVIGRLAAPIGQMALASQRQSERATG